jgi:NAD(P)-dependent dehydrogenase (short-subunit alcohol dehydrogenase family)
VAEEDDVIAMLDHAVERFGHLDIVFNNAGVGGAIGPLTETSTEDWDYTFDVLAKGVFLGIKHAARILRRQGGGGSIINTASIAGLSGDGGPLVYSAAKAAVVNLTMSAAVELAPDLIRVNAICPGFIATPLADNGDPEGTRVVFAKSQPWPDHPDWVRVAYAETVVRHPSPAPAGHARKDTMSGFRAACHHRLVQLWRHQLRELL